MKISVTLADGTECPIIVKSRTEGRLSKTCFRAIKDPLAGNFIDWRTINAIFRDEEVLELFIEELSESWEKEDFGTSGVTLELERNIGWESTDDIKKYSVDELETFTPNRRSTALRVKPTCRNRPAPYTSDLTIIYEFRFNDGEPKVFIHSLYPGCDIGELKGDITKREGRVFFGWHHPGE